MRWLSDKFLSLHLLWRFSSSLRFQLIQRGTRGRGHAPPSSDSHIQVSWRATNGRPYGDSASKASRPSVRFPLRGSCLRSRLMRWACDNPSACFFIIKATSSLSRRLLCSPSPLQAASPAANPPYPACFPILAHPLLMPIRSAVPSPRRAASLCLPSVPPSAKAYSTRTARLTGLL